MRSYVALVGFGRVEMCSIKGLPAPSTAPYPLTNVGPLFHPSCGAGKDRVGCAGGNRFTYLSQGYLTGIKSDF